MFRWLTLLLLFLPLAPAEEVRGPRPLMAVALRLQSAWGLPVTYEEPHWLHPSDVSMEGDPLRLNLSPRFRTVTLPEAARTAASPAMRLAFLQQIIDTFNAANAPLRYRVMATQSALHLIPVQSLNASGHPAPAVNILETAIRLPVSSRPFRAQMEAIAAAIGVQLNFVGERILPSGPPPVVWGTNGSETAREALLSLFRTNSVTYSWQLNCAPASPESPDGICVLNVAEYTIGR